MGRRKEGRERGRKGRRQEEAVAAAAVREDVEEAELMGRLCRNVLRAQVDLRATKRQELGCS